MGGFGGIAEPLSAYGVGQESLEILSGTVISGLTWGLDFGNAISPIFHPNTFPKLPIPLFPSLSSHPSPLIFSKTPYPLPPLLFCPMPKMKNRLGNFFSPNRFPKLRNVSLSCMQVSPLPSLLHTHPRFSFFFPQYRSRGTYAPLPSCHRRSHLHNPDCTTIPPCDPPPPS
jgi:hypothetical protein